MKLLVCLGNVPDTTTKIKFAGEGAAMDPTGVQWVINPWDELALTRALELKEDPSNPVDQVLLATVGLAVTEPTIRKGLAIGADRAVRVDLAGADSAGVAAELAEVVRNEGADIVFCGIESSDYNGSAVGGMLAEFLDLPSVSGVSGMRFDKEQIILTRDIDGGFEEVTLPTPFVAIVQKGIAKEPRIPAMRGIMMARKKPLQVVEPTGKQGFSEMQSFALPQPKPPCKMVDPDQMNDLVHLLQNEAKVL